MLLALNNLLPYVGARDDSCQTMFSSLDWSAEGNNHLFMPQRMVTDLWDYHVAESVRLDPPAPGPGRTHALADWLGRRGARLNTEATRVVVRHLCDRGHRVALRFRRRGGPLEDVANACADPRLAEPHAWIPIRLYETDFPP